MTRTFCVGEPPATLRSGTISPNARSTPRSTPSSRARPARMSRAAACRAYEDAGEPTFRPTSDGDRILSTHRPRGRPRRPRVPAARERRRELGQPRDRRRARALRPGLAASGSEHRRRHRGRLHENLGVPIGLGSDCITPGPSRPEPALTRVGNGDRELAVQTHRARPLCARVHRDDGRAAGYQPADPRIRAEFGVTNRDRRVGAVGDVARVRALSQFPSGVLGDRYGERTVILAAVGATALLLIAVSPSILAFIVFLAVVLGAGILPYSVATTFSPNGSTTSAAPSRPRRRRPNRAGSPPRPSSDRYGWRAGIALGVAVAVPVFALFAWRVRPHQPLRPDQPVREAVRTRAARGVALPAKILYDRAVDDGRVHLARRPPPSLPVVLGVRDGAVQEFRRCCSRCTSSSTARRSR